MFQNKIEMHLCYILMLYIDDKIAINSIFKQNI